MIYCHNYIYMNTKLSISCGEGTPTLRTSQDITTYIYIYNNDLLAKQYLYEHKVISQLWSPTHFEHPKALQHIYIYISWKWPIDINCFLKWSIDRKNKLERALVCDVTCGEQGLVARSLTLRTSINLHIGCSNCFCSGCSKCESRKNWKIMC